MIHTPVCDLWRIRHPIVLGGMAGSTVSGMSRWTPSGSFPAGLQAAAVPAASEKGLYASYALAGLSSCGVDRVDALVGQCMPPRRAGRQPLRPIYAFRRA